MKNPMHEESEVESPANLFQPQQDDQQAGRHNERYALRRSPRQPDRYLPF